MSRKLLSRSRYHPVPYVAVAFAASVGLFCSHARHPTTDINIDTGVWTELRANALPLGGASGALT